ncbi:MAG: hypothetical protein ACFCAD_05100 [Pleurocapsa sp.]
MSDSQRDFNSDDLVGKIVQASTFESEGNLEKAIALYQEIAEQDPTGNYGDVAREALTNLQDAPAIASTIETQSKASGSWWSKLNIKAKTSFILIGVALGSSIGINTIAYVLADQTVTEEIEAFKKSESNALTKEIALFMQARLSDIKTLANLAVLADPELSSRSS